MLDGVGLCLVGDSLVGQDADGRGALSLAVAKELGEIEAVGVSGSTSRDWLGALGLAEPSGRWAGRGSKVLSAEQIARTVAPRVAGRIVVLSLGSNDAAAKVAPEQFASNVGLIAERFKRDGARGVVWVRANNPKGLAPTLDAYASTLAALDVPLVDVGRYSTDALHPTVKEHQRTARGLAFVARGATGLVWLKGLGFASIIAALLAAFVVWRA